MDEIKRYKPGELVYLRRSIIEGPVELLTVLWDLDPDDDEADIKYLTRTATHAKKTVFHCEVIPAMENEEKINKFLKDNGIRLLELAAASIHR